MEPVNNRQATVIVDGDEFSRERLTIGGFVRLPSTVDHSGRLRLTEPIETGSVGSLIKSACAMKTELAQELLTCCKIILKCSVLA